MYEINIFKRDLFANCKITNNTHQSPTVSEGAAQHARPG